MENASPTQEAAATPTQQYVGFWKRLLAFIIDQVILAVASGLLFGDAVVSMNDGGVTVAYNGIYSFIPLLYTVLFWGFLSATPGKMALGMKIVKEDGTPITWKDAILRALGYIPSAIVFFLGFLWIGWDAKKQGWHDKIAHTVVVKK